MGFKSDVRFKTNKQTTHKNLVMVFCVKSRLEFKNARGMGVQMRHIAFFKSGIQQKQAAAFIEVLCNLSLLVF